VAGSVLNNMVYYLRFNTQLHALPVSPLRRSRSNHRSVQLAGTSKYPAKPENLGLMKHIPGTCSINYPCFETEMNISQTFRSWEISDATPGLRGAAAARHRSLARGQCGAPQSRRAAERKQKRSASPKTPAVGDAKRRKCPSPRSQAVIAVKHEAARALPPKARKRMMKQIAEEEGVGQQYARQVAARLVQKRELSTRKGVGGKPRRIKEEDAEKLLSTLEEHAYELTFKQLEEITNIPASTIWRWSKRENFRQVNKGTRPCLSEAPT
jgi:hypothetical protein